MNRAGGGEPITGIGAARLTIDLGALAANWGRLREVAGGAECAAVVKADAYGIGIETAVPALAAAGCRTFFVAHLDEGRRARRAAPDAAIFVFNGLPPGHGADFADAGLRPVLGSLAEIAEWGETGAARGGRLPAAIHVDTGMNRLGFPPEAATALAGDARLRAIEPALLMSHLSAAENEEDPATARQSELFGRIRPLFPAVRASLSNSSGLFRPDLVPPFDLVRPGYALYGGNPTPGRRNPMRPVVTLDAPIVQMRTVPDGARVGYNGRWTARGERRLATVSLGYADGFLRAGSGTDGAEGAVVLVGQVPCPVVGSVSMDLTIVDVTGAPPPKRGDRVTVIGGGLDIDEVGRRAGTIGYEILTGLGRRFERRYRD